MKIKNAPKTNFVFGDLSSGDVFMDTDGEIKTAAGFAANTVVLEDGWQYYVCDDHPVTPVDGTFILN